MKRLGLVVMAAVIGGCAVKKLPEETGNARWGLDVTWHGQSCFTLKDSVGRTIVIDPYDETVGFGRLRVKADALLVTHNHFDHNNRSAVRARLRDLELVESTGTTIVASGLAVAGITAFHDAENGAIDGPNTIYTFVMGGLRCAHLGDLGQKSLTGYQRKILGAIDVLFVPVGGVRTLDAARAKAVVDELKPGAVFPMHYGDIRFYRLDPVSKFTALFPAQQIVDVADSKVRVRLSDLTNKPVVYILSPSQKKE